VRGVRDTRHRETAALREGRPARGEAAGVAGEPGEGWARQGRAGERWGAGEVSEGREVSERGEANERGRGAPRSRTPRRPPAPSAARRLPPRPSMLKRY
jgi:hypothetical protein